MKYAALVVNEPLRLFASAAEAVEAVSRRLYIAPSTEAEMLDALAAGKTASCTYGFAQAFVYPPGVEYR